jgi:putative FmdB family regulatory protein
MPIYEYRCQRGHQFEVTQRMSDDPIVSCETCEAPVERVFHPVAVHFKGSGFYNTDYGTRRRSREMREAAEGGNKDGASSKSDSDSGSKSESSSKSDSDSGSKGSKSDSGSKSSSTKSDTTDRPGARRRLSG